MGVCARLGRWVGGWHVYIDDIIHVGGGFLKNETTVIFFFVLDGGETKRFGGGFVIFRGETSS